MKHEIIERLICYAICFIIGFSLYFGYKKIYPRIQKHDSCFKLTYNMVKLLEEEKKEHMYFRGMFLYAKEGSTIVGTPEWEETAKRFDEMVQGYEAMTIAVEQREKAIEFLEKKINILDLGTCEE